MNHETCLEDTCLRFSLLPPLISHLCSPPTNNGSTGSRFKGGGGNPLHITHIERGIKRFLFLSSIISARVCIKFLFYKTKKPFLSFSCSEKFWEPFFMENPQQKYVSGSPEEFMSKGENPPPPHTGPGLNIL